MLKLFSFISFFCFLNASAQLILDCGTEESANSKIDLDEIRIFESKNKLEKNSKSIIQLPIQIHIVRRDDGTGGLSLDDLETSIEQLNVNFDSLGIVFFQCSEINYIDNTDIFENYDRTSNSSYRLMVEDIAEDYDNSINIFYFNTLLAGTTAIGGYGVFPWNIQPQRHHIGINNLSAINGTTLGHEIGHYLGLLHPHHTGSGKEFVNRTNCDITGDFCCDTPADNNDWSEGTYAVGFKSNGDPYCAYESPYTDINGDTYRPSANNLMSYNFAQITLGNPCRDDFTPNQDTRVLFFIENDRQYLICNEINDVSLDSPKVLPSIAFPGSDIDVNIFHLYSGNQSETILDDVELSYFLSTDCSLNSDDIFLGKSYSNLGKESSKIEVSETFAIPAGTEGGAYYILIKTDDENNIEETNENNNLECVEIQIVIEDLGVNDVSLDSPEVLPSIAFPGSDVDVNIFHLYSGNQSETILDDVELSYFLSTDCSLNSDDILLGKSYSNLGEESTKIEVSETFAIPAGTERGAYYILIKTDDENNIEETNENNNLECVEIQIVVDDLGINDSHLSNTIVLYPNPAEAQMNYRINDLVNIEQIELLSILGENIIAFEVNESQTLDLSAIETGVYLVRFITIDQKQVILRVIKK